MRLFYNVLHNFREKPHKSKRKSKPVHSMYRLPYFSFCLYPTLSLKCSHLSILLINSVRSFSHGAVAAILDIAEELQIVDSINKHLPHKQLRDGFTVGGSLLLAAIGRICNPTSKRN